MLYLDVSAAAGQLNYTSVAHCGFHLVDITNVDCLATAVLMAAGDYVEYDIEG